MAVIPRWSDMSNNILKGFESRKFGLLGEKLSHSFSPRIHSALADYPYGLYEVSRDELGLFMKDNDLAGFNVTIPYKEKVMKYLDDISHRALSIGAVNTVVKREDGTLFGDNTDYDGFLFMLSQLGVDVDGRKALVLGSGGASKTCCAVLREQGAEVVVISRSGEDNYTNIAKHSDACLIVNTTPVGMYPDTEESPLSLDEFTELQGVCDLIYNPLKTRLLLQAQERGIPCVNGLSMLVSQAKRAAEIFTDMEICDTVIDEITRSIADEKENIVLIGMPGCGKSTVGKILSKMLGKTFVDTDEEIQKITGSTPAEIITMQGEAEFRRIETEILSKIMKESSLVVATGGGVVTQPCNKYIIRQNARAVFIERDIEKLATEGRPLSVNLCALYDAREALYRDFADVFADGNGDAESVAKSIREYLSEG